MTLFRTVDPAAEPVFLADAKGQLKIDHDSEDEFLNGLIRAARDEVEKATGSALIAQSWRLALDGWPGSDTVLLRRGPVKEVLSVTVYGEDGEASLVDPARYQLDPLSSPARLHFAERPEPGRALNGIEIDFCAGYGEAGTDVPDLFKRAIMMLVAHWYEFRSTFGAGDQPVSIPDCYERLIAAYRAPRL